MSQPGEMARVAAALGRVEEAVVGLEQGVSGMAATQELHGLMLRRLLTAVAQEPDEGTRLHELLEAVIGRLDAQGRAVGRMEAELARIGAEVSAALAGPGGG